jgi:hypothetical protein
VASPPPSDAKLAPTSTPAVDRTLDLDLTPWAQHVEETYIAVTLGRPRPLPLGAGAAGAALDAETLEALAAACACAVAARFLAVGKPRSLGIVADDPRRAALLLAAHRVWHAPTDVRWAGAAATSAAVTALGGRVVPAGEALTADIVCVDVAGVLESRQVRRGSHLNLLAAGAHAEAELSRLAVCIGEVAEGDPAKNATLGDLAAGLRDGRQLDEITLLFAGPSHGAGGAHGLRLARAAVGLPA